MVMEVDGGVGCEEKLWLVENGFVSPQGGFSRHTRPQQYSRGPETEENTGGLGTNK